MKPTIVKWPNRERQDPVAAFLQRPAFDEKAEEAAQKILADIRENGDSAVVQYAKRFDGVSLAPEDMLVQKSELAEGREAVDRKHRVAVREAHKRIEAFARAGMKKDWRMSTPRGGELFRGRYANLKFMHS